MLNKTTNKGEKQKRRISIAIVSFVLNSDSVKVPQVTPSPLNCKYPYQITRNCQLIVR